MENTGTSSMRAGDIKQGKNPRTYMDPQELAELESSIQAQGVLQPILIRPTEDGFEVVAGFRRLQSAIKVLGPDYQMPILLRELTDAEAEAAALTENVNRANMSPAEEAISAAKVLGQSNGDRDEASKRLGWSRSMLDKRLALMNCAPEVLTALTERKIQLGHAELLAAVTKEKQVAVLNKLLEAPELVKVSDLKANLEQIMRPLADVIFDKGECARCPHNSGNQRALFGEAVSDGNCTNASCYEAKTVEGLEVRRTELLNDFPRVQIVNPGENFTVIRIVPDGNMGVGEDQAKACRACADFGAAISNVPGKVGKVFKDTCFNSVCNSQKVAAYIKSQQPEKPEATTKAGGKDKAAPSGDAKKPATSVQDSQRVKDYRVKEWRRALKRELQSDPVKNHTVLITLALAGHLRHASSTKLSTAFDKLAGTGISTDIAKVVVAVETATDEIRTTMTQGIVLTAMDNIEESYLVSLLKHFAVDLRNHWELNKDFLELLTKSEIEFVAEEVGLKAAMDKAYAKTMSGKKDEIIKALMAVEGFAYKGALPKSMQYTK